MRLIEEGGGDSRVPLTYLCGMRNYRGFTSHVAIRERRSGAGGKKFFLIVPAVSDIFESIFRTSDKYDLRRHVCMRG